VGAEAANAATGTAAAAAGDARTDSWDAAAAPLYLCGDSHCLSGGLVCIAYACVVAAFLGCMCDMCVMWVHV
jgi:hypothetical protein